MDYRLSVICRISATSFDLVFVERTATYRLGKYSLILINLKKLYSLKRV